MRELTLNSREQNQINTERFSIASAKQEAVYAPSPSDIQISNFGNAGNARWHRDGGGSVGERNASNGRSASDQPQFDAEHGAESGSRSQAPAYLAPSLAELIETATNENGFHDRLTVDCDLRHVAQDAAAAAIETWIFYHGSLGDTTRLHRELTRALIADAAGEFHRRAAEDVAEADDLVASYGDWCRDGRGFGR